jgi:ribosomal 30S subunit maturation factor RimM
VTYGDRFDPAALFGCRVIDESGHSLGRVTAVVHRGDGCDVLVERRHWLRHTVVRLDLEELVPADTITFRHVVAQRQPTGPSDDRVA